MPGKHPVPPELKSQMQAARAQLKAGQPAEAAAAFRAVADAAESQGLRRPAVRARLAAAGASLRAHDKDAAKADLDKVGELVKGAKNPDAVAKALSVFVARLRTHGRDKVADYVQEHAEKALGRPLPVAEAADHDDEDDDDGVGD
ncbi:MAG: hypothetical protein H6733_17850 [Alphaproteobacteria bacterium]|nr:hypothetical protein [Alphaproteobacteria bacterium]